MKDESQTRSFRARARKLRLVFLVSGLGVALFVFLFLPAQQGRGDVVQIRLESMQSFNMDERFGTYSVTNSGKATIHYYTFVSARNIAREQTIWIYKAPPLATLASGRSATHRILIPADRPGADDRTVSFLDLGYEQRVVVVWYEAPNAWRRMQRKLLDKAATILPVVKPRPHPMFTNYSAQITR